MQVMLLNLKRNAWCLNGRRTLATRRIRCTEIVEPAFVLIFLPVLIGVAAEVLFRDTLRASLAATLVAPLLVYVCLTSLDPDGNWNWGGARRVGARAPARSLAAVMVCFGRIHARRRRRRDA
jgi:hypothetical protein